MAQKQFQGRQVKPFSGDRQLGYVTRCRGALVGGNELLKFRQVSQGVKAPILARFDQEVAGLGIVLKTFGVQVKTGAQIPKGFIAFPKHNIERRKVIPRFGLVGNDCRQFFENTFKFDQIAHLCVKLGDSSHCFRGDV